ncbi:MAG TPA: ferredoxin [Candidatus Dojkabacteria bacterium]|nr:ferredoxin [Candidatus Dojkabacteria bacterium]
MFKRNLNKFVLLSNNDDLPSTDNTQSALQDTESTSIESTDQSNSDKKQMRINKQVCIRCGTCAMMHPEQFEILPDGTVSEIEGKTVDTNKADEIKRVCPVGAIFDENA